VHGGIAMNKLVVALALLSGCNWAVKHPAATGGIVAGTLALGTCELAAPDARTHGVPSCLLVGGSAGVGIWLITAVALWLGSEDDATATPGEQGTLDDPSNLEEAPVFVPRKQKPEPPPAPKPPAPDAPKPPDPPPTPAPDPAPTP
jgi:hypothetical protein